MLNPQVAYLVEAQFIRTSAPRLDIRDLHDVRRELARFIQIQQRRETPFENHYDAWNAFVGASPTRPGTLTYTSPRCHDCQGRGFTSRNITKNLSRTGSPYTCGTCRGTRRGQRQDVPARYMTSPQPQPPAADNETTL
jgi:hypothetical protein